MNRTRLPLALAAGVLMSHAALAQGLTFPSGTMGSDPLLTPRHLREPKNDPVGSWFVESPTSASTVTTQSFLGAATDLTSTYGCDAKGAVHLVITAPAGGVLVQMSDPINRIDICVPAGTKIRTTREWTVP